jgi:hypothetical protein
MNKKHFSVLVMSSLALVALASCGHNEVSNSSAAVSGSSSDGGVSASTSAATSSSEASPKKTPSLTICSSYVLDKKCDGKAVAAPVKGNDFTTDSDGVVTIEWYAGATKLDSAPKNAGNYTLKIVIAEGADYLAASTSKDFKIVHDYALDTAASVAPTESAPGQVVIKCAYDDMTALSIPLALGGVNSQGSAYYTEATTASLCETEGAKNYTLTGALADEINAKIGSDYLGTTAPGAALVDTLSSAFKAPVTVLPKLHHQMAYTLTKAPTGTAAGAYHGVCSHDTSHTMDGVLAAGTLPTYAINEAKSKVTASYAIPEDTVNDYNAGTCSQEITQWNLSVDPNGGSYREEASGTFSTSAVMHTVTVGDVGSLPFALLAENVQAPAGTHLGAVQLYVDDVLVGDSRDANTYGMDYRFDVTFGTDGGLADAAIKYGNLTGVSTDPITLFGNVSLKLIWANAIEVKDFTATAGTYADVDSVEAFGGTSLQSDVIADLAQASSDFGSRVVYKVPLNLIGTGNYVTWLTLDDQGGGTLATGAATVGYFDASEHWIARTKTTTLYRFITTKLATSSTRAYDSDGALVTLSEEAAQAADTMTISPVTRQDTIDLSSLTGFFTSSEEIDNLYLDAALTVPLFSSIATPAAATFAANLTYNEVNYTDASGRWCYADTNNNLPLYIKLAPSV